MAILEQAQIVDRANAVLSGLRKYAEWAASLDNASVSGPPLFVASIAPVLVTRSGPRPKLPDYFIVTIHRAPGISARLAHDAETGELLEVEGVKKAGAVLPAYVDPLPVVQSHPHTTVPAAPDAVWRPCRQSTSRFNPFWRFVIDGRTLYVRSDGVMFEQLTTTGRG